MVLLILLHYFHYVFQRFRADPACPCKGMVKDIDQKQNQRDRHRECSRNQVLRLDVFHSKEKCERNREYPANK